MCLCNLLHPNFYSIILPLPTMSGSGVQRVRSSLGTGFSSISLMSPKCPKWHLTFRWDFNYDLLSVIISKSRYLTPRLAASIPTSLGEVVRIVKPWKSRCAAPFCLKAGPPSLVGVTYRRRKILFLSIHLSQFIQAAITEYHRLGGLQTTEIYFSQF